MSIEEIKDTKAKIKEYDGFEKIIENIDGRETRTVNKKVYMSDTEAKDFLQLIGDEKVADYFLAGKAPLLIKLAFGAVLDTNAEEMLIAAEVLRGLSGYKMFYTKVGNKYMLLLPKAYSCLEKTVEGEYANQYTPFDARLINFPGGEGHAGSYDVEYLKKRLSFVYNNIKVELQRQGISISTL